MLTPTIDFGEISITLPCALKDIGDVTVDEEETFEYNYDGIDALSVNIYLNGCPIYGVTLDNRDKDIPIKEKTIIIFPVGYETEFHGIRCYHSKWEDTCEIIGTPGSKIYGNFLVPLENGYYLDCRKSFDKGTVTEMTVFRVFDSKEEYRNVR